MTSQIDSRLPRTDMRDMLYLTKVTYLEDRKEILTEFSNSSKKILERFKFFPFLALPKETDSEKVKKLLLDLGIRAFTLSEKENYLAIHGASFSILKQISYALAKVSDKLPLVIEPERQFLLEKNWTYFDSFMQFQGSLVKVESVRKDVSFAVIPEIPFVEVARLDQDQARFFVEQAALASILVLPLHKIPKSAEAREELFLENMFFKNAGHISWEKVTPHAKVRNKIPFVFDKVSSIDFSPVWAQLFSKQFFNIGLETKNCSCCKPFTLEDKNLLPSSLISIECTEDNFFFESSSPVFAQEFDELNLGKELREEKRQEYFTNTKPVGPLRKGETVLVPLLDAKKLLLEENASLGKNHSPEWFCKSKESFFSTEISKISEKLKLLSESINEPQTTLFEQNDFAKLYAQASFELVTTFVANIPFQLVSYNSRFYSPSLARSIISIQEATLYTFREFSREKGYRVLHASNRSTLIRGHSPLSLAKKFSQELSLPQPQVASFAQKKSF